MLDLCSDEYKIAKPPSRSTGKKEVVELEANHHRNTKGGASTTDDAELEAPPLYEQQHQMHHLQQLQQQEQQQGSFLSNPLTASWNWVQKKKDQLEQEQLRQLAADQMRKLQLAQKQQEREHQLRLEKLQNDKTKTSLEEDEDSRALLLVQFRTSFDAEKEGPETPSLNDSLKEQPQEEEDTTVEDDDDVSWIPPVRFVEEKNLDESEGFILQQEEMNNIARYVLPRGIAFCRWKRIYSLARDGDSFDACLHFIRPEPRTLMVVRTTRGYTFGGYADAPWEITNANFHGSAQACLFSFQKNIHSPNVYRWTGANRYIQYCDTNRQMFAFGGGGDEGSFGLCVEKAFQVGSTGPCDTFGNDALAATEDFNILDLEFWAFLTGQF